MYMYIDCVAKLRSRHRAMSMIVAEQRSCIKFQWVCFRPVFFPARLLLLAFEWNGRPPLLQGVCFFSGPSTSVGF